METSKNVRENSVTQEPQEVVRARRFKAGGVTQANVAVALLMNEGYFLLDAKMAVKKVYGVFANPNVEFLVK